MPENGNENGTAFATLNSTLQAALDERYRDGWRDAMERLRQLIEINGAGPSRQEVIPPARRIGPVYPESGRGRYKSTPVEIDGLVAEAEMSRRLGHTMGYLAGFRLRKQGGPPFARKVGHTHYYDPAVVESWHTHPDRKQFPNRRRSKRKSA